MGQIQVFIPASGKTVAIPEKKAVVWGEAVNWQIYCDNPIVKQIRIEFEEHKKDGKRLPMFGNKLSEPYYLTKMIDDDGSGDTTRVVNISGFVPKDTFGHTRRRNDKYTIRGLDVDGNPVAGTELDPEIISTDPGGD